MELEIEGRVFEADISSADGTAQLVIDGRTHEAKVSEPEPGIYILIIDHRVYRCNVEVGSAGSYEIFVNGRHISVVLRDKKHLRGRAGAGTGPGGKAILTAPMPGKIVRLLRSPGDEVAIHDGLMVVEAMKMQNEVQAPKTGRIAEIRVTEGQTVNAGDVLAVIE